jgi:hypothetical protein
MSYRDPQGPLDVRGFVQRLGNIRGVVTRGTLAIYQGCTRRGNICNISGVYTVQYMYVDRRVFTKFRILEISYISYVFFYFVYHTKLATISRN